ncbi:hypothetical protein KAFR_0B06670 [Kazachstania africana CBS 2517]|uniref:Anaphase-promoting complex subunit 4 WD40 domain-containing protein n=1 Tax=Kazachstania africana (strain ATCC 22294 / BCRC 22015 / CBS 2517 / CECT 1963 / NBRC 1671 / NRRL Y-8276) TaxID=1071382 RepID=H2ARG4_KAZAF|nr:hypothetical protein KAFR_0B06670 [Kazachstania africana CBS 2517]CCF56964.1 hypothetical protein KAFR_0B06670 [Kazachstania africana CBS 2517]
MSNFKQLSHIGPSLCVKFYNDTILLAAVGPFIHVYEFRSDKLINKCRIFHNNKIHGFDISQEKCVLYGGKSVSIISISDLLNQIDLKHTELYVPEWVVACTLANDNENCYVLTCYNQVLILNPNGVVLHTKKLLNERSILYSGSIKVLDDRVVVNAGTVMGGILIWDLFSEQKIHNLKGHVGSIFYVTVSDDGKYVASCSDDRSIRLWNLENGQEVSIGWGHTARIWNLKFFNNNMNLISVGEDCTCRTWDISSESELITKNVYEVHLTKNCWSCDVQEELMIAATAGNDGRIKLIDMNKASRYGNELQSFTLQSIGETLEIKFEKNEIIKGFHWFSFGLIAITSLGKIIKYVECTQSWNLIVVNEDLASYSNTIGIDNTIIFSNNKGYVLLLAFSDDGRSIIMQKELHTDYLSKVTNCMCVKFDENYLITLESPNPNDNFIALEIEPVSLEIKRTFKFNKPGNFVSSCLEVVNQNYLLVGSRFSTVAIFNLSDCERDAFMIKKLNPGDTVTSIKFVESKDDSNLFSITNRDGFYNIVNINFDNETYEVIHSNKIVKGFLEGAFYNKDNEYITYGFKSTLFYMYNEQHGYEILSQLCGGAHRQWKLCSLDGTNSNEEFMLVYIKASELYLRRIYKPIVPETLVNGLHGREIRDISILPQPFNKEEYLFATASEDTTIRLNKFNLVTGDIKSYWAERKHVSGLQRLKFISNKFLISSSAREELFLWAINTSFSSNPYITVRATLPTSAHSPDLRIMDFDTLFINEDRTDFIVSTIYSDSTMKIWYYDSTDNQFKLLWTSRYKTCCLLNVKLIILEDELYLLVAPTDGHLVVYNITNELETARISDNKLVNIKVPMVPVTLSNLKPEIELAVHQSGIKCMDVEFSKDTFKVYTGGDDNALSISKFYKNGGRICGEFVYSNPKAASSTITSCQLFKNGTRLLSTSVDQIVRVWKVEEDKLVSMASRYTTVADTGSSDIIKDSSLLIGGVGLSVWEYDENSN